MRYDQLSMVGIASLIGVTVVFAIGVERGKQLARAERSLLTRQEPVSHEGLSSTRTRVQSEALPASAPADTAPRGRKSIEAPSQPHETPSRSVPSKSRYAVQVVTYSRVQLAHQELQRLQQRGESAFLVMRDGRTVLYVGPFASKERARAKLTALKTRYQDCFVKSL
jgi:cell division septation protein DedD